MTDTTRSCLIGLKQALNAAGFLILNPATPDVTDDVALAAQLVTNAQVAQALRGGSGLTEELQQAGACAAVRTALTVRANVPGQLAPMIAQQRAALAPPPPPPPPSGPSADTTKIITYVGIGAMGLALIGGLWIALRR